jgi:hypothetical protein
MSLKLFFILAIMSINSFAQKIIFFHDQDYENKTYNEILNTSLSLDQIADSLKYFQPYVVKVPEPSSRVTEESTSTIESLFYIRINGSLTNLVPLVGNTLGVFGQYSYRTSIQRKTVTTIETSSEHTIENLKKEAASHDSGKPEVDVHASDFYQASENLPANVILPVDTKQITPQLLKKNSLTGKVVLTDKIFYCNFNYRLESITELRTGITLTTPVVTGGYEAATSWGNATGLEGRSAGVLFPYAIKYKNAAGKDILSLDDETHANVFFAKEICHEKVYNSILKKKLEQKFKTYFFNLQLHELRHLRCDDEKGQMDSYQCTALKPDASFSYNPTGVRCRNFDASSGATKSLTRHFCTPVGFVGGRCTPKMYYKSSLANGEAIVPCDKDLICDYTADNNYTNIMEPAHNGSNHNGTCRYPKSGEVADDYQEPLPLMMINSSFK